MDFKSIWNAIIGALTGADITGDLDGHEIVASSIYGCGKKAMVIKGWVDPRNGPAIRFRAAWDDIKGGEFFYQKHPSDNWIETSASLIKLELGDTSASIVGKFRTGPDDEHSVRLTADLNFNEIIKKLRKD